MHAHAFVFGTLKSGFPLHERGLRGAQPLGIYRTQQRFPLLVAGPWFAPMMFNEPGMGHHVIGEVYSVTASDLVRLDQIESVGKPGNYRLEIWVEEPRLAHALSAFVYMKSRDVAEGIYHSGLLETYRDTRFLVPEAR
jgi:gamma-glutamylaminecyclotransferase